MDTLKQEIGAFLRLLGAILAAGLGCRMLAVVGGSAGGWYWLPKICGSVLVVAGSVAVLLQLFSKWLGSFGSVRINVDTSQEAAAAPSEKPAGRRRR